MRLCHIDDIDRPETAPSYGLLHNSSRMIRMEMHMQGLTAALNYNKIAIFLQLLFHLIRICLCILHAKIQAIGPYHILPRIRHRQAIPAKTKRKAHRW